MNWGYIAPVLIVLGFVVLGLYLKKAWPFSFLREATTASRMQSIIDSLVITTPAISGVFPRVLSRHALLPEVVEGIKVAFRERIGKAGTFGWTEWLEPSDYVILVFPSVRDYDSNGNYAPSFQVFFGDNDPYDGSIYDQEPKKKGGWTFAAEQVLLDRGVPVRVFIIADNNNFHYTINAVSNGLDHLLAYPNNRELYEATKSHAGGGGHPLW